MPPLSVVLLSTARGNPMRSSSKVRSGALGIIILDSHHDVNARFRCIRFCYFIICLPTCNTDLKTDQVFWAWHNKTKYFCPKHPAKSLKTFNKLTLTPPGKLMVSCGERKMCSSCGQSGSRSPGAAAQMKVRLRDWLTPKLPAFSTPKRTCKHFASWCSSNAIEGVLLFLSC